MKLFLDNNEIELLDDLSFNIKSLASYGGEYLKDYFVEDCTSYVLMVAYTFVLNRMITGFHDEKYDVCNLKNAKIFNVFKEIRIALLRSEKNYALCNSIKRIDVIKNVNKKVNIMDLDDKKLLEIDDNYNKTLKSLLISLGKYSKKNSLLEYRKLLNKFQGVIE